MAVAVAGSYAYIADNTSVQVINVSNPGSPSIVGSLPTTTATKIAASGSKVYVIDGLQFKIIDVSNPAAPWLVSTWDSLDAQGVDASGTLALLVTPAVSHTDPLGGVHVLDVSDPYNVKTLEDIVVPGTTRTVVSADGYVYAGDSSSIVDVIRLQ